MRFFIWSHFAVALLGTGLLSACGMPSAAAAFAAGAGVSWMNILALVFSWPRILAKKLVALSIGVIVIKLAILGFIIYTVVTTKALHLGWFSAGLSTVVLSTVLSGFALSQESPKKAER